MTIRSLLIVIGSLLAAHTFGAPAVETPEFQRARIWATNVCAVCHLFPAPETLDRQTWSNHIIPLMRIKMGVAALENDPSPASRSLMEQWHAIWKDYYLVAAPEKELHHDPR